jgi:hypothetical protein
MTEPVAWMQVNDKHNVTKVSLVQTWEDDIPLYTHPEKTLTDEEIEEFAYAFELWQLNNPDKALEGIIDFARAILKKASEK